MERIIEMNWYGLRPGTEPQGEPNDCYEQTEAPNGDLIQGEPCESVSLGDPRITSVSWSLDRELNGMENRAALVRLSE